MKRILAAIFIISLFLIAGCAKEVPMKSAPPTSSGADTKVTITEPAGTSTEAQVTDVEAELDELDFDEDFNTAELDALDEDLNFEI